MTFWEIFIFQDFSMTFHDSNFFQDFLWPWEPCSQASIWVEHTSICGSSDERTKEKRCPVYDTASSTGLLAGYIYCSLVPKRTSSMPSLPVQCCWISSWGMVRQGSSSSIRPSCISRSIYSYCILPFPQHTRHVAVLNDCNIKVSMVIYSKALMSHKSSVVPYWNLEAVLQSTTLWSQFEIDKIQWAISVRTTLSASEKCSL